MESQTSREACLRLANALAPHSPDDEQGRGQFSAIVSALRSAGDGTNDHRSDVEAVMAELARYIDALACRWVPGNRQLDILHPIADTTRQMPFWRPLFGLPAKPDHKTNGLQAEGKLPSDCILEVGRRIISASQDEDSTKSDQVRCALRLIANCCADNNINRSIIVNRGGVEAMMQLAASHLECDLLIPTLYNVCVDYDEPAAADDGTPWPPLQRVRSSAGMETEPSTAADCPVNAAEQRLGTFWTPSEARSSVEILLSTKDHASQCLGTLADLIEMASRVALYGLPHLIRSVAGSSSSVEGDTARLIESLLLQSAAIAAREDVDCRVSLCQAVLNVLSQPDCHNAVISIDGAIWTLAHLPSVTNLEISDNSDGGEEDEEAEEQLQPYRKAILKTIYEISGLEAYGQHITDTSKLIHDCIDALKCHDGTSDANQSPWASICVLLSNSITSIDRAARLVRSTPIVKRITNLLAAHPLSDPDTLLPAIDLATRLALCREGQDAFQETKLMTSLQRLLDPTRATTSEVNAIGTEIQRQTVSLARLLIKGRGEHLDELGVESDTTTTTTSSSTFASIIALFKSTSDPRTKIEVGRLSIEVLRTLFSSTVKTNNTASQAVHSDLEKRALSIFGTAAAAASSLDEAPSVADTISSIVTQSVPSTTPQPQQDPRQQQQQLQSEAEGWFGLGLLSMLPYTHDSIKATLERDGAVLLKRLREITSSSSSSISSSFALSPSSSSSSNGDPTPNMDRDRDPRLENIKVLVANLLQQNNAPQISSNNTTAAAARQPPTSAVQLTTEGPQMTTLVVQQELEAAAKNLGMISSTEIPHS